MVLYIFLSELFIVFPDPPETFCPASTDHPLTSDLARSPVREEKEVFSVNTL
jgi:hypothetical protein